MPDFLLHLLRGGSWFTHTSDCRLAYRNYFRPGGTYVDIGFRLICHNPAGHALRLEELADG